MFIFCFIIYYAMQVTQNTVWRHTWHFWASSSELHQNWGGTSQPLNASSDPPQLSVTSKTTNTETTELIVYMFCIIRRTKRILFYVLRFVFVLVASLMI